MLCIFYVRGINMIGVYSLWCMLWNRNRIQKNYPSFFILLSFSSCDIAPTFKFLVQITLENAEKFINRITCFTKTLPILYMLKKY